MRKINILALIVFVNSVIYILFYINLGRKYKKPFELLNENRFNQLIEDPFTQYFYKRFECAKSIDDMLRDSAFSEGSYKYFDIFLNDPFSKDSNEMIKYIPIYNRITKKREEYILLSTGIDGEFNNSTFNLDTLFSDNWKQKIKKYNNYYQSTGDPIGYYDFDFSFYNLFWGNKDLLIQHVNCVKQLRMDANTDFSLKDFFWSVESDSFLKDVGRDGLISFIVPLNELVSLKGDGLFKARYKDLSVVFKFANLYETQEISDEILIYGIFYEVDTNNRIYYFSNCYYDPYIITTAH